MSNRWSRTRRGQANLLAVTVALVLLVSVLGASVAIAESALLGATETRDPADGRAAATLATRIVTDTPATYPSGVVPNRSRFTATEMATLVPAVENASVRVTLGDRTLFERGDPVDGVTVRRAVLVGAPQEQTRVLNLTEDDRVSLSDRTDAVDIDLRPGPNTTVQTVRVNGRVVLHNESGLAGPVTIDTSRRRTTTLVFESLDSEPTPRGRVELSYVGLEMEPATLEVSVDV